MSSSQHHEPPSEPANSQSERATAIGGRPSDTQVQLSLLAMVMFFGGSVPAYTFTGRSFGPATANLFRFVIAATVLSIAARKVLGMDRADRARLLQVGALGIGLMSFFLGAGVDKSDGIIGSIIVGLEPIGVALAGVLLVGDRPTRTTIAALVIGFTGALIASGVFGDHGGKNPVVPILLLLGMVITFSIYTARVRQTPTSIQPLAIAATTQVGALFFVVPACVFDVFDDGMFRHGGPQLSAVLGVLFLGFGSALAYLLLCLVLSKVESSRVAVSMFLTPLFGIFFSWLIAGEHLRAQHAVGAGLVVVALWVMEYLPGILRRRSAATA